MKVYRLVVTNIPKDRQNDVFEALYLLIKSGIITTANVHWIEEEERNPP